MEYLLLAILFSSLFPISFRIAEKYHFHSKTTIILNFIFGSIFILTLFFIFSDGIQIKPFLFAFLFGIPTGTIYYSGLVLYQRNISKNGLSIAALFMKIALVIPILLSIIIFLERPTNYQYIGIVFALIAIITLNGGIKQFKGITKALLLLFILSGIGDFASKIFQELGDIDYINIFIFSTFISAATLGIIIDKKHIKGQLNKINIISGIIIGIFNTLSTFFIVNTLSIMDASKAMVIINISIILFVSFVGIIFFKERLKRNESVAFIIAILSILLMNL